MAFVVRPAPACLIADTVEVLGAPQRSGLWQLGTRALGAYLEVLVAHPGLLEAYTGDGYGVLLIGESRAPGWLPSAQTGAEDAGRHLGMARSLGIPEGATIVDDCETPAPQVATIDRVAHVDTWAQQIASALYLPAAYIGEGFGLTSAEWQARPNVHRYAKSCSRLLDFMKQVIEPMRGYSWVQGQPPNVVAAGAQVDFGALLADYQGGRMALVYDAAHAPT